MKRWSGYLIAYVMWVVAILLGVLFLVLGRLSFPVMLGSALGKTTYEATNWAGLFDRGFSFVVGVGLIVLLVVAEDYFRVGVQKNELAYRLGKFFGPLVLLVFCADFAQIVMYHFQGLAWYRWALSGAELALGVFLVVRTMHKRRMDALPAPPAQ